MKPTRRSFLRSSSTALVWGSLASSLPAAFATREGRKGKVLVLVFLRGGADGLNLVVPHGDESYYRLRDWIAVPRPGAENGALDLDGFFGLHPHASPLLPSFESGLGVALQAVGYSGNTRSHFEEQDVWETGVTGTTLASDGWLNRHLQFSEGHGPVRAISFGDALPRILRGEEQAYVVRNLAQLSEGAASSSALAALQRAHGQTGSDDEARELVERGGRATLEAMRELKKVADLPYESRVEYPATGLAGRFRDVARMIRADVGLEVAELDFGGWDTHQNQGGVENGPYSRLVGELSGAIAAFLADLEDRMDDVLVLTVSEFGRTAAQNGTAGTDHGWANCVLAFGGPVRAAGQAAAGGIPRKVLGTWPGLSYEQLHDGRDLMHTTDFRDVFAEVAGLHLGNEHLDVLFPGHGPRSVGLV